MEALDATGTPMAYLGRAAVYARTGQMERARQVRNEIEQRFPGLTSRIVAELTKHRIPGEFAQLVQAAFEKIK